MSKYFFYGVPRDHTQQVYGLYSFAVDCFILIESDLESARKTASLLFPKIDLRVVELTSAKNYSPNLIDNSICENWTFTDKQRIHVRTPLGDIIPATELKEKQKHHKDIESMTLIKEWAWMTGFWVRLLKITKAEYYFNSLPTDFLDSFLEISDSDLDNSDLSKLFYNIEKRIYKTLYVGIDYNKTDQLLQEISLSNETLKNYKERMTCL